MAADAVTGCLQELTDYAQFERLCSDLMSLEGYPALEPLGGFKDKGRDAVHVSKATNRTSIFSYSVREDWRKKLDEGAGKVRKHKHPCDELVYLTTSAPTAGERDKAVADIKKAYGWHLEIFGLERLGVLLRSKHRRLIGLHPQIFPPAFFPPIYAGIDPSEQNFVFVDYVDADEVLALWLARRLLASGYRPWCRKLSLFPGERASEVMDGVIRNHAARVVAVYSTAALRDPDAHVRRAIARAMTKERGSTFFLPLLAEPIDRASLDSQTRELAFLRFDRSWAEGIGQLVEALETAECPRPLSNGPEIASQTMLLTGVTRSVPETLYSNCFPITRVPEVVHVFKTNEPLDYDTRRELATRWAFRATDDHRAVSFHQPPDDVVKMLGISKAGGACWAAVRTVEEVSSRNLLAGVLETYRQLDGKPLTEVFLHARSTISWDEFEGYKEACPPRIKLTGIRVRRDYDSPRVFRDGTRPVLRGTLLTLNERTSYLYGSGFKPRLATYDGSEVPIPLRIDIEHGEADVEQVAADILGLTKLNYNTCRLGEAEPVTVGFSDAVGEILITNPRIPAGDRRASFRFYI